MSNTFKYNVEYRKGDLHPETGKVFTPESYNEVAKRQAHNGWRVMSDSEVSKLKEIEESSKLSLLQTIMRLFFNKL